MNIYVSRPGFICCAGNSQDEFMGNLTAGNRDGIKKIKCGLVNEEGERFYFVGKIDDERLSPTGDRFDMRFLQIVDAALKGVEETAKKAIEKFGAERVAVCIGQCDNGSFWSYPAHKKFFETGAFPENYDLKAQGADYPATFVAEKIGAKGPALSFATACSSSATAIIKAKELLKAGIADAVVAGGADVVSDTVLVGFDGLGAVSRDRTNPFSKNRSGITLGEAGAFFVLSREDLDGSGIVLAGTGESSDASHMTAPLADGSGAKQAMECALRDASLEPCDIDYVNLHGTGTHLNDSMEGKGIDLVFGGYKVPVSTIKAITGHTLGAAAALELAACFYAIKQQVLPVQVWDGVQDEEIPVLNIVSAGGGNCGGDGAEKAAERRIRCCMSNSFAFGGCNASLIIKEIQF